MVPVTALQGTAGDDPKRTILEGYARRGLRMVFYAAGTKGPRTENWPSRDDRPEDYRASQNVGIFTGVEIEPGKYLIDVDFDWPEGLQLAKAILPATGFGFGRASKKVSHAFYTTSQPLPTVVFKDVDGKVIVELRSLKADGTIGLQTMAPPSVHPSGELVELQANSDITHADDIDRRVRLYAVACLLYQHLDMKGLRHAERMALAGTLLELGATNDEAILVGEALARVTGNDADDVRPVVTATAAKVRAGSHITSSKTLAKTIGDDGPRVIARMREWLCGEPEFDTIVMVGGELTTIVDRAEQALLNGPAAIYQRGGALVRPVRIDSAVTTQEVRRASGSSVLQPVREAWLIEGMGRVLRWVRRFKPADPAAIYARTLLARGEWRFPVLRSILRAPTLGADGRIIEKPGFDDATGLLLDFDAGAFTPIPDRPTLEAAITAMEVLAEPLRGFPFADGPAKSTALAALLAALVRPSLRSSPLIGFDAPTAGTGKSLLAEIPGLLASGTKPPALSQGKTPEEDEKRLATVLFAGDPIIHVDNCERAVSGDFICSMATQEFVQARILGQSERRILPSTALVLLSGNNLAFAGDTSRRAIVCRLDAGVERPDTREFDFDCHAEVLANRTALVVAGLTILRAYRVAGSPCKLTPMGSFDDFAWIRGALVWLGFADPAETRGAILENDPRRDELLDVIGLWQAAFGAEAVEVAEIQRRADKGGAALALYEKLVEVACRGAWSGKSVGWWLRRYKDRVVAGERSFRCKADGGRNGQLWSVSTEVQPGSLPLAG